MGQFASLLPERLNGVRRPGELVEFCRPESLAAFDKELSGCHKIFH